jgi:transcriptional regulator with XRE-family HTH domain
MLECRNFSRMTATSPSRSFGDELRHWRARRRVSQLSLALDSGISQRHLSFVESGRARPSREMVLRLAEHLSVPLRDRNRLLVAAGFAPHLPERRLDDPALETVRRTIDLVLSAHEPYPAFAIDRHWTVVAMNAATRALLDGVAPELLAPPMNAMRIAMHPEGMAPHIVNYNEWRVQLFRRLEARIDATSDPVLEELHDEIQQYPAPHHTRRAAPAKPSSDGVFTPLVLSLQGQIVSLLTTSTVFITAEDITLSELALECFFPADDESAAILRAQFSCVATATGDALR